MILLLLACVAEESVVNRPAAEGQTAGVAHRARGRIPQPTENVLDADAEKNSGKNRRAWFDQMHRRPPGVDYKAIEAENGRKQVDKRRALVQAGQSPDPAWVEHGSWNQAGSMHVTRRSTDGTALYAGSDLGGIWKGSLEGGDWQPIGDNLNGGAHFLAVFPAEITGDPDILFAATNGGSLHRSIDDGASWEALSLGLASVRRLVQASDGSYVAYMIAGGSGQHGLLRSVDRGASFSVVRALEHSGDVWVPRNGGSGVYLLDGDALSYSGDQGETWTELASTGSGRGTGELVGSEAWIGADTGDSASTQTPRLWATQYDSGAVDVYRSDDGGGSWVELGSISDYWGEINASAVDSNLVAYGGVEMWRSDDGGDRWRLQNGWADYYDDPDHKLHADIMGIDVVPDQAGGEAWYVNTHGGVYVSYDGMGSADNLSKSGMRVGQYYSTLTSTADPSHLAAGAQDQGYQVTNTMDNQGDAYDFDQILSGDYGHLTSGDGTHRLVFSVYPGFVLVAEGEERPEITNYLYFPDGESYSWLPTVLADPTSPDDFFFAAKKLYRYVHQGRGWEVEQYSEQSFGSNAYLSALAFAPSNPDRMYAATSQGNLYASNDHGVTWERSDEDGPTGQYYYGQALVVSRTDPDTVVVGGSGYDGNPVYRSTDGGSTWIAWSEGLPATMALALAESADGTMFVGTETAAYMRTATAGEWVDITGTGAPITAYWSAEALASDNTIRFGTYGRGIWDYEIPGASGVCVGQDVDGDGVACTLDCDDADASRFPGAGDPCGDGIDQDCFDGDAVCLPPVPDGCGCGGGGSIAGWALGLSVLLGGRRRRARSAG